MAQKYAYAIFALLAVALVAGCTSTGGVVETAGSVKEFSMDSFYVMENGKPHPQFSLSEITVSRGDTVRLRINVINGTHDFNLDEFNVKSETPTGEVTVVEFVAGKSGEFVYYCAKPGHRANGHWGTLKVN